MKKILVLEASHRSDSNTGKIVQLLTTKLVTDTIALINYEIGHYTYDHKHAEDDFMPLMKKVATYDVIIFATPVYWYSMSGRLKVFLDRITDCLQIDKELGRSLKGKYLAAICCSSSSVEFDGFFEPFRLTSEYLEMNYLGDVHTWIDKKDISTKVEEIVTLFAKEIKRKL